MVKKKKAKKGKKIETQEKGVIKEGIGLAEGAIKRSFGVVDEIVKGIADIFKGKR